MVAQPTASPVSYIGLAINAGSRDDPEGQFGMAHFLEHTIFRGTKKHSDKYISSRLEEIGGELNAFTAKEMTMIHSVAPAGYVDRAMTLIADLVKNADFPSPEIDRERNIIIEEIHSYEDSPSDAVFDIFDERLYTGNGLSHNILGSTESLQNLTSDKARAFLDKYYTPANMVLYCVDANPEKALRIAEKRFGDLRFPAPEIERPQPQLIEPFSETQNDDNNQANTLVGCRVPGFNDPLSYPLRLLGNILGGPAMNSLLNWEIREKRGWAYSVDAYLEQFSNAGAFMVYYGCDPTNNKKCEQLIRREIDRLAQNPLGERKFTKMRDQFCGQISLQATRPRSLAINLGQSMLLHNEIRDVEYTIDRVREITPDQLCEAARIIASQQLSRITLS